MAFKGKPSINKRNRGMAARGRAQEKELRRDQRSAERNSREAPAPMLDPVTGQPLSADEQAYREFQDALKARAEQELVDTEREAERKGPK